MNSISENPRIVYFLKGGREARLGTGAPREFFYGYLDLKEAGCNVQLILDAEIGLNRHMKLMETIWNSFLHILCGIPGWAFAKLWRVRGKFDSADLVLVSTNTFGLSLGALNRLGLIRTRIIFIAMGLVEPSTPARWRFVYQWALRNVHVLAMAQQDAKILSNALGRKIDYLPFGVDSDFWCPSLQKQENNFALSIGNDRHRDYSTLLNAWRAEYPLLRIVTKLPLHSKSPNVEIIHGDWFLQSLSDSEMRTLIQTATFIVLPIANTYQPSGQSVALQAMACGKTVLLTDFPGLWNRDQMCDGMTCVFAGKPSDVKSMSTAIETLFAEPSRREIIGSSARMIIESELNSKMMAVRLRSQMEMLIGRPLT